MKHLFSHTHTKKTAGFLSLLFLLVGIFFSVFVPLFVPIVLAADDQGSGDTPRVQAGYEPLAPLPGLSAQDLNTGGDPVGKYFGTIYRIGVSAVLVIAVVMFIVGGIQYMTSDSIAGKGNGRDTIAKALIGILLATGSYLLLFIIGGAGSVRVGFDMPELGFVGAVDPRDRGGDEDDEIDPSIPGTPQQCYEALREDTTTLDEKQYYCGLPNPQKVIFKVPNKSQGFNSQGCYLADTGEAYILASNACGAAGGRFIYNGGLEGYYCIAETTAAECEASMTAPEFPALSGWDDARWDLFCDTRNETLRQIPESELSLEERSELKEVYQHLSHATGGGYQTSGYYTDESYCNGAGGGRCHAGIDMSGIGVSGLKAPQYGIIKILRTESMQCYGGNAKIALIAPNGTTWVYTHVHIASGINNGDIVSAGTVIARPSTNPGYYNSATGACDTFPQHLHLEVWSDASCFEPGTNDPFYWSDSRGGSNNSCPHSGFVTDTATLAEKTMCPIQAVYEGLTSGVIQP